MKFMILSLFTFQESKAFSQRYSIKKGIHKTFTKFLGKPRYWSFFFNKVARMRPAILLKQRL